MIAKTTTDKPIKSKLYVKLVVKIIVNTIVPIGINDKATVKIIPNILPKYLLSISFWMIEKNWTLNIVKNKL